MMKRPNDAACFPSPSPALAGCGGSVATGAPARNAADALFGPLFIGRT
jgi:hypothetical protein